MSNSTSSTATNPLLATTGIPDFEVIQPEHVVPAVQESLGCLIPRNLHPAMDRVKPKGKAQAGALCASAVLVAGGCGR